ncbi:TetR/AcrR family transcriptional regulator [Nocardia sp.]|uniref:TetR/AcrR family transcriptional regulator n=1 Tax=Nocardia sp. TaxID=1821 RepID=UPI00262D5215|nr:TetR/AcrR family transcriptional regulator [Nocardia sp.]
MRARRTQADRTAQTRRAILDATFDALVDVGFSAVTTPGIAHRAGVSLGAVQHHFPTKSDLLSAAVAHAFDRSVEEYREAIGRLDPAADLSDAAIDLLWSMYSRPTYIAWHELWTAARTDPELATAVIDIDRRLMATIERVYAELFPANRDTGEPRTVGIRLHLVFALFDGLALSRSIPGYEPYPTDAILAAAKALIRSQPEDNGVPHPTK